MSEVNKITPELLEQVTADVYMPVATDNWNGLELEVRRYISFSEMLEFVEFVTDMCFTSDNTYMPEVRDYAIRVFVISRYTNIELPEDTDKRYELLYGTDIMRAVLQLVDAQQINEIVAAIDTKINYITETNIEAFQRQVQNLTNIVNEFGQTFEGMLKDSDPEVLAKFIDAVANNGMDEEKLVKTYMEEVATRSETVE